MSAAWVGGTKTPPYSIHAEKALLGACLAQPRLAARVVEILPDGGAFFRSQHATIYEAIVDVHRRDEETDRSAVTSALTRDNTLDTVGGPGYLIELQQSAASEETAVAFARQVQEKAMLRQLIDIASDMLSHAYGGADDFDEIVATAIERLGKLAPAAATSPPRRRRSKAASASGGTTRASSPATTKKAPSTKKAVSSKQSAKKPPRPDARKTATAKRGKPAREPASGEAAGAAPGDAKVPAADAKTKPSRRGRTSASKPQKDDDR